MSRQVWNLIKASKGFNVALYRRLGNILLVSIGLNVIMGVMLCFLYLTQPEPDFYATSGIAPPILVNALSEPNYKSVPLLEDEQVIENNNKVIPQ